MYPSVTISEPRPLTQSGVATARGSAGDQWTVDTLVVRFCVYFLPFHHFADYHVSMTTTHLL